MRGSTTSLSTWMQYGANMHNSDAKQTHNQINSLSLNRKRVIMSSPSHLIQEYNNMRYVALQCYDVTKEQFS